jgi:hypothetical protein
MGYGVCQTPGINKQIGEIYMKTQVHLYVKNESFWTRFSGGGLWFINIFRKLPVDVAIDGNKVRYKPQNEPYVIDVTPGEHVIEGRDPRAATKKANKALTGAIFGASAMGAGGGSMLLGAMMGADAASSNVTKVGLCGVKLNDGDIIKLSCRANKKGAIVFKQLQ